MLITTKIKALYCGIILLVQIYLVYAATLYVAVGSPGFFCIVGTAAVSAAGAFYYVLVRANRDQVGGYNAEFTLEERRRIG